MTKLIKKIPTKVKTSHVEVDACVLWCIDPRFRKALWDFEKSEGYRPDKVDIIKVPGGGKGLAGKKNEREEILSKVAISVNLHKPKIIIPMFHFDCGAYKPLKLKKLSEEEFLIKEMEKARDALAKFKLPIHPVIVSFDEIRMY